MTLPGVKTVGIVVLIGLLAALSACRTRDPKQDIAASGVEAYWVVDPPVGDEQYVAPAVRLTLRNQSTAAAHALEATVVFRFVGETQTWGSDWRRVAPHGRPLAPNEQTVLVLKGDARFHRRGAPEDMLTVPEFKDCTAEVFLRLGASPWVKFAQVAVDRRIGAKVVADPARP